MTKEIIEILKKNVVSFNDHDVIFGGEGDLTDLANEIEEAINYSQCCVGEAEQLPSIRIDKVPIYLKSLLKYVNGKTGLKINKQDIVSCLFLEMEKERLKKGN